MSCELVKTTWKHWLFLVGAIVFEVGGSSLMKATQSAAPGMAEAGYIGMLALIGISYYLLALSTQGLPVGVAYAFWEGLGLTLITLVSVFILHESMGPLRLIALAAVLGGAVLIHHGTGHGVQAEATENAGGLGAGRRL